MLRVLRGGWAACSEVVEVFFEEEEGYFSESRMVLLGNCSVCVGASSLVSSTNLDDSTTAKA
jgi:hypothetical protein